jgi:hypothetical protein
VTVAVTRSYSNPHEEWQNRCSVLRLVIGALAMLLALGVCLPPASAQPGEPVPARAPASSAKVVVVADLLADETANAKLRGAVYDAARARGFEPDSRVDVAGAALSAGVMREGSVSSDEAALETLRKALGAALLIRVAAEGPDRARLVVVSDRGARSRVVDAPPGGPEPSIVGAVSAMIAELAPGQSAPPEPPPSSAGVIAPAPPAPRGVQTADQEAMGPEAIRRRWEARGGLRVSYEVRAMATGLARPDTAYQDTRPFTNTLERGKATTYGVGGGVGFRLSAMLLPLAEPHKGGDTWGAFRIGAGADASVLYVRPPVGYSYKTDATAVRSRDTDYESQAHFYGVMPIQLGFLVGFGKYRSDTLWRGTGLGLAYSPSFIYSLEIGKTVGDVDFNYGGIEASIDVIAIEANREGSSDAQIRLAVLMLPRVKDDLPWLLSAGIGVVWY